QHAECEGVMAGDGRASGCVCQGASAGGGRRKGCPCERLLYSSRTLRSTKGEADRVGAASPTDEGSGGGQRAAGWVGERKITQRTSLESVALQGPSPDEGRRTPPKCRGSMNNDFV